jgi:hypothetical protein
VPRRPADAPCRSQAEFGEGVQPAHLDYVDNSLVVPPERPEAVASITYFDQGTACGGGTALVPTAAAAGVGRAFATAGYPRGASFEALVGFKTGLRRGEAPQLVGEPLSHGPPCPSHPLRLQSMLAAACAAERPSLPARAAVPERAGGRLHPRHHADLPAGRLAPGDRRQAGGCAPRAAERVPPQRLALCARPPPAARAQRCAPISHHRR